jgi:hypothetical protein
VVSVYAPAENEDHEFEEVVVRNFMAAINGLKFQMLLSLPRTPGYQIDIDRKSVNDGCSHRSVQYTASVSRKSMRRDFLVFAKPGWSSDDTLYRNSITQLGNYYKE